MISVRRLNGAVMTLNAELIETVESAPDTVITLVTGNRIVVLDRPEEVVAKIVEYRRKVNSERPVVNPIRGFEKK